MKTIAIFLLLSLGLLPARAQSVTPTISADETQVLLQGKVLLDALTDGFMRVLEIRPAPNRRHFLVLVCGFECSDNKGFLFRSDGAGKRGFPARGSYILRSFAEWSADSQYVYFFRINSTAADLPPHPPREAWKQIQVRTSGSTWAVTRRLKPQAHYAVFRLWNDVLNVRAAPLAKAAEVGTIPSDGGDIRYLGTTKQAGKAIWVKIKFGETIGWVNQSYLYEVHQ